jgi:hypothetical protein
MSCKRPILTETGRLVVGVLVVIVVVGLVLANIVLWGAI